MWISILCLLSWGLEKGKPDVSKAQNPKVLEVAVQPYFTSALGRPVRPLTSLDF